GRAVLQERFPEPTQRVQHGRVKRPLPKLARRYVTRLTFRQNSACIVEDFLDARLHELRGSNGGGDRTGIHTQGLEADKPRGEVGGASAAKGIKHDIACS